jgi:isopenicillin N synthase-like dioxygenase
MEGADQVARELQGPSAEWGGFHVVGHGIDRHELVEFEDAMRAFFELPIEVKRTVRRTRENARGFYDEELTKNRRDWKEVFDYGADRVADDPDADHSDGINQWPRSAPEIHAPLLRHFESCERVGLALLRGLCNSLGVRTQALDPPFEKHASFIRLNCYAPCPDPAPADAPLFPDTGHFGVHHHTDAGALTVLHQDKIAGLQVEKDGKFLTIDPIEGSLFVNLGDLLQIWSNDRYRSATHRVLANAERTRYSAPLFLNPSYETICEPLLGLITEANPAKFRAVSWAHFRDQRSAGDYADYGAEIQIEDYRIA